LETHRKIDHLQKLYRDTKTVVRGLDLGIRVMDTEQMVSRLRPSVFPHLVKVLKDDLNLISTVCEEQRAAYKLLEGKPVYPRSGYVPKRVLSKKGRDLRHLIKLYRDTDMVLNALTKSYEDRL